MSLWHKSPVNKRRWKPLRLEVLNRANWKCRSCGAYGNEVDHIQPLDRGGEPYQPDNLQALCRGCHIAKTRTENENERGRVDPERARWRAFLVESMPTCSPPTRG